MPEGDTVYRTARLLDRALSGQVLTGSELRVPQHAAADLTGGTVVETVSRGKHLLTRFDNELTLRTHLKMEGTWHVHPLRTRWRRPAHTARVILRTATTEAVGFQVVLALVEGGQRDVDARRGRVHVRWPAEAGLGDDDPRWSGRRVRHV